MPYPFLILMCLTALVLGGCSGLCVKYNPDIYHLKHTQQVNVPLSVKIDQPSMQSAFSYYMVKYGSATQGDSTLIWLDIPEYKDADLSFNIYSESFHNLYLKNYNYHVPSNRINSYTVDYNGNWRRMTSPIYMLYFHGGFMPQFYISEATSQRQACNHTLYVFPKRVAVPGFRGTMVEVQKGLVQLIVQYFYQNTLENQPRLAENILKEMQMVLSDKANTNKGSVTISFPNTVSTSGNYSVGVLTALDILTLGIPGWFGMPWAAENGGVTIKATIKDINGNVVKEYTETGKGTAYTACYWGYSQYAPGLPPIAGDNSKHAISEATFNALDKIIADIDRDAKEINSKL